MIKKSILMSLLVFSNVMILSVDRPRPSKKSEMNCPEVVCVNCVATVCFCAMMSCASEVAEQLHNLLRTPTIREANAIQAYRKRQYSKMK
jgi:hypothetical protein